MPTGLPKNYVRQLWSAVIEFELLAPGDRVLVGFSGGKDSSFLLYSLAVLRRHFPLPFDLGAVHIDMGFAGVPGDLTPLKEFCDRLQVPLYLVTTQIGEIAFHPSNRQNPCPLCAHLRRGAVNDLAVKEKFNKVALAHHLDDAVETFLMAQLYAGKLETLPPKTFLDRSGLTVIRPLITFREKDIKAGHSITGFTPIPSPCPLDGRTKRETIKQILRSLAREIPNLFDHLTAAMRQGHHVSLWPPKESRLERKKRYKTLMSRD